jgi:hypothetical protein
MNRDGLHSIVAWESDRLLEPLCRIAGAQVEHLDNPTIVGDYDRLAVAGEGGRTDCVRSRVNGERIRIDGYGGIRGFEVG